MIEGVGIHSGEKCYLTFHPAPVNTGIVFIRPQVSKETRVPALTDYVVDTSLAVTLGKNKIYFQTVEHLMFALHVCSVTDVIIEAKGGPEIPILDGSAGEYIDFLESLEFHEFQDTIQPLVIREPVSVTDGNRYIVGLPSEKLQFSYSIDYAHALLKDQSVQVEYDPTFFKETVGRARTFGFLKDVEYLRSKGLAQGGSTVNVLVFTPDGTLNPPRFPEEPIYHKLLDLLGDISLVGRPVIGHILGSRGGHALDVAFGKKLLQTEAAHWRPLLKSA